MVPDTSYLRFYVELPSRLSTKYRANSASTIKLNRHNRTTAWVTKHCHPIANVYECMSLVFSWNVLYYVQKIKASKLYEMQLWCTFNANVYEYHIHRWWFSIPCCGRMVGTFSVMFLQCHLMSWVWPLQSMLLLQALDPMAEGKHGTTVSRPLVLYIRI